MKNLIGTAGMFFLIYSSSQFIAFKCWATGWEGFKSSNKREVSSIQDNFEMDPNKNLNLRIPIPDGREKYEAPYPRHIDINYQHTNDEKYYKLGFTIDL